MSQLVGRDLRRRDRCPVGSGDRARPEAPNARRPTVRDPREMSRAAVSSNTGSKPFEIPATIPLAREPMRGTTGEVKAETVLGARGSRLVADREPVPGAPVAGAERIIRERPPAPVQLLSRWRSPLTPGRRVHVVSAKARSAWLCAYDPSSRTGEARSISAHPGTANVMAVSEARHGDHGSRRGTLRAVGRSTLATCCSTVVAVVGRRRSRRDC